METTDKAENDKLGISASMVDWNVGGTKVLGSSALSFNAALTNMAIYNKVWPDDQDWIRPYGKWSAEAQWKCSLDGATVMKTYAGYDYTTMALRVNGQRVELGEHNSYVNATVKHTAAGGWRLFGGAAWSELRANRHLAEFHLKGTAAKSISAAMKLSAGIESFLRNRYAVAAAFADVQCRLPAHLFAQLSARAEASSLDHRTLLLPRASLTYQPNSQWQLSLMTGSYSQAPADDLLPHMPKPTMQKASHTIVSLQRHFLGTTLRAEAYYKDYRHLPLRWDLALLASNGHGWSKGIDLYAENTSLVNHLATVISYSYNDSRRRYLDYPTADVPQYATRHNVRLTAKYYIEPLKSYIGMTESMASGRPYHDPDRQGYMNARTPVYNSLDISLTVLVSPKVIVYTSLSNVLGRHNIYGYTMPAGSSTLCPVSNPRSRFFYIGLFVSLKIKTLMTSPISNRCINIMMAVATVLLSMCSLSASAQNADMHELISQSVSKMQSDTSEEAQLRCVAELRRIEAMFPDSTAPKYQAALQSLNYAIAHPQAEVSGRLLAETLQTIGELERRPTADASDVHTLKGYRLMVLIVQNPAENGPRYYLDVQRLFDLALKENPGNELAHRLSQLFAEGMKRAMGQ
jgi:hypothetical protein